MPYLQLLLCRSAQAPSEPCADYAVIFYYCFYSRRTASRSAAKNAPSLRGGVWSYWADSNRRPADYELGLTFEIAFLWCVKCVLYVHCVCCVVSLINYAKHAVCVTFITFLTFDRNFLQIFLQLTIHDTATVWNTATLNNAIGTGRYLF